MLQEKLSRHLVNRMTWAPRRAAPRLAVASRAPPAASGPGGPLSPPRRGSRRPAGPLELRSRPAAGGLARGRRLRSRAPAPGTAAKRSAAREGPPEDGGRADGREHGLRHPSRSVTAAATTTRAVLLLPTCRKDTEHARAETTSG